MIVRTKLSAAIKDALLRAAAEGGIAPGGALVASDQGVHVHYDGITIQRAAAGVTSETGALSVNYTHCGQTVATMTTRPCSLDKGDLLILSGIEGRMLVGLEDEPVRALWPLKAPADSPRRAVSAPAQAPSWWTRLISRFHGTPRIAGRPA